MLTSRSSLGLCLLLGLSTGLPMLFGCSLFSPRNTAYGFRQIEAAEDGSIVAAIDPMQLQVTLDQGDISLLESEEDHALLVWTAQDQRADLNINAVDGAPTHEELVHQRYQQMTAFEPGQPRQFEGGHGLPFRYWSRGYREFMTGYVGFYSVGQRVVKCEVTGSAETIERAHALCSSLRGLDADTAGGQTLASR